MSACHPRLAGCEGPAGGEEGEGGEHPGGGQATLPVTPTQLCNEGLHMSVADKRGAGKFDLKAEGREVKMQKLGPFSALTCSPRVLFRATENRVFRTVEIFTPARSRCDKIGQSIFCFTTSRG